MRIRSPRDGPRGPWIAALGTLGLIVILAALAASIGSLGASLAPLGTPRVRPTIAETASSQPVVLVGAGDIASCGSLGDEATAALLDEIEGTVFTAGDNVYERGSPGEFAACYEPTWGRFRERTLPVLGNHEYETEGAAGHFEYFGSGVGDPAEGWYVADVGDWSVYALNSNCSEIGGCGPTSRQAAWVTADLAANPRPCTLAIWHHPLFSSGEHGNQPQMGALWRILQDASAEVVISGHDHDYERFGPQDADGAADDDGLVEFVVGTGGRSHYRFETSQPNSLARNDDTFGVLRLDLATEGWTSEFLPVAGATFSDVATGTCH